MGPSQFPSVVAVVAALLFVSSVCGVPQPQTSPSPCVYTCPATDTAGFGLVVQPDTNNNEINCSYPAIEGEDPNDFFCLYSKLDGSLVQEHDAGFCPTVSVCTAPSRRRRADVLPRSPKPRSFAARDVRPSVMEARSQLGAAKKKRSAKEQVQ